MKWFYFLTSINFKFNFLSRFFMEERKMEIGDNLQGEIIYLKKQ